MKAPSLLFALCVGPLGAIAQTTLTIAECHDLPETIETDTTLEFTAQEISCSTNTLVTVSSGVAVEITSAEPSTKFNNIKFEVSQGASFLCTVPQLDWTSVVTEQGGGDAAMTLGRVTTTTFAEDVTFNGCGCGIPQEDSGGFVAAAITSMSTLVFEKTATFKDTIAGGALVSYGRLTFEGDVLFENNKHTNNGGGLSVESNVALFKGTASFIGNEAAGTVEYGGRGAGLYSNSGHSQPMTFSGPVLFKGNFGVEGALALQGSQNVIFESHVTFEDNVMQSTMDFDRSRGGAMFVQSHSSVEFQAGVTATGNSAKSGGAFYFEENENIDISGPVTITNNTALFGGAIWTEATKLTLPSDADISSNTAIVECPGISYKPSEESGVVEFTDGATFDTISQKLCYLGSDTTSTPVDLVEDFDCQSYVETAPRTSEYPYLVIDTRETKTWNLGTSITGGLSCPEQLIVYVTGGEELTIVSTAALATMEDVRIEVLSQTKLILEVPDLTLTGIFQSQRGGSVFVGAGSSMDVMHDITFMGNSVAYETFGIWPELGGPAIYSDGDVKFYGEANFLGNGQYKADADSYEVGNEPGGAILNAGTMEFMKKANFKDNFNPNGGVGGAVANSGDLTFNVRSRFQNNSVYVASTDAGERYGGRGGALYNYGPDGTVLFKGEAMFKENVGILGGCAVATRGTTKDDDEAEGDNRITFEGKAKFKDNVCDGYYPSIFDDDNFSDRLDENKGGGALLAYGASTVVFSDSAVFKRNEAIQGGAITNSAAIFFNAAGTLIMEDNIAETCPDILNNNDGTVSADSISYAGPNPDLCDRS